MRKATPSIAAVLTTALLILAPSAAAEEIVPPGNSAASQYTEAFPTTGGERETDGGKQGKAVPADVLGARDSHRLESKGKDGKAVAEFAAETAPAPAPVSGSSGQRSESAVDQGGDEQQVGGGGTGSGGQAGGGSGSGGAASGAAAGAERGSDPSAQPSGSSGFGEVVGQMTGSSSGELGLWLPLVVIGAVAWSLFYLWRQRQRVA